MGKFTVHALAAGAVFFLTPVSHAEIHTNFVEIKSEVAWCNELNIGELKSFSYGRLKELVWLYESTVSNLDFELQRLSNSYLDAGRAMRIKSAIGQCRKMRERAAQVAGIF